MTPLDLFLYVLALGMGVVVVAVVAVPTFLLIRGVLEGLRKEAR